MNSRIPGICLCVLILLGALSTSASAGIVIEVDLTTPNQITVNATGADSLVTVSGSDTTGVYLEGFYGGAGNALSATLVSGNFTNAENPADNTPSLFRGGAGSDTGLNIWSWSTDVTVSFTAGSLAFTGTGTWGLDPVEYADMLNGNLSGDAYFPADTVDDLPGAVVLGTWTVTAVPEPSSLVLLGVGLGLLSWRVRRRRRAGID
jgi:hypothetical protein